MTALADDSLDWAHCTVAPDAETIAEGLKADDPKVRARAVSAVCPCRMERAVFERFLPEVRRLLKDPNLQVRKAATHVLGESLQLQSEGTATTSHICENDMAMTRFRNRWRKDESDLEENDSPRKRGRRK